MQIERELKVSMAEHLVLQYSDLVGILLSPMNSVIGLKKKNLRIE